jgi:L-aspartate oxidase
LDGRTNLAGLYAAGEVASTGVHGANRLASNSLLEGLVFGARAAHAMARELGGDKGHSAVGSSAPTKATASPEAETVIAQIQRLMWQNVGIVREGKKLRETVAQLETMRSGLPEGSCRRCCEARNIADTALLITRSALARLESRGAHYRMDYPVHDDQKFQKHSVVLGDKIGFV